MRTAIRKHLRDFIAILFLFVVALGVAGYVLSNERFYLPGWVPGVGTDFYTVNADFSTAQAVVPGQGQSVNIAGVKVGDIGKVELHDGVARVELRVRQKYAPIYRDAKMLLRPKTGLKDMFVELDPGNARAGKVAEGGAIPVANTLPDVNLDEILGSLDSDTRAYLGILVNSGGEAFGKKGYSADLRETFKRFEPTNRDLARITKMVAARRGNLRRVVHNFQLLSTALAGKDRQLSSLVDSSNANFGAIAQEDQKLQEALGLLPGTLGTAKTSLGKADRLARQLGPALQALRPGARALGPSLRATRPFLRDTTPIVKNQLRPFARIAQPPTHSLRLAAKSLRPVIPRLTRTFTVVNSLLNTLAYNPPGAQEGFLYWASWVNHAGASIFSTQDAHGAIRRGLFLADCASLNVLQQIGKTNPNLKVLVDLLNAPNPQANCAQKPTPGGINP